MFKDYYQILEVQSDASFSEIKLAYKRQALKWHPDKNPDRDTTSQMQDIIEAYLILSDQEARKRYDDEYPFYQEHNNDLHSKYVFHDITLEKWITKAVLQAQQNIKQILYESKELTKQGFNAAGDEMLKSITSFIIMALIFGIIFIIFELAQ